jgi:hypothetical protein
MAILGAAAYAGYLYVPVAVNAATYKDLMQHLTDVAATQGHPPSWLSDQLAKNGPEYGIPEDAVITSVARDGRLEVRVQFVKVIEFPGYPYNYEFDHTTKSTAFLTFK